MVISYNLYTRNPEDIKIVVPYAIEATKAQSLRDVGVELLPFEEHEGSLTMTLDEIACEFGLTRERVRQIKEKALRGLRKPSRSAVLRGVSVIFLPRFLNFLPKVTILCGVK